MITLEHSKKHRIGYFTLAIIAVLLVALSVAFLLAMRSSAPQSVSRSTLHATTPPSKPVSETPPQPKAPAFDKQQLSTSDASSLWVVVNKQHPLNPASYTPNDLIQGIGGHTYSARISTHLSALLTAAANQGLALDVVSAYRSYTTQTSVYGGYVHSYGQATADTISARPGYSEHQTGLAVDIGNSANPDCNLNECFGATMAGEWLAAHATDFGFVVRYQKDTTATTGYSYEPWHIRYIGPEAASEYKKEGATSLEQFFGVSGGNYAS